MTILRKSKSQKILRIGRILSEMGPHIPLVPHYPQFILFLHPDLLV